MMPAGSFDAPHFAGTDLPGAFRRAKELLGPDGDLSHLTETQKLAWHLLRDASRLAAAAPKILEAQRADEDLPSEAIEVIVRKALEHTIFLEYLHEHKQDEKLVERYLANCRAAFDRANKRFRAGAERPPEWPNYEQMAASHPGLYDLYRQLSYLAHPKTCMPYTLTEAGAGMSKNEYFLARAEHVLLDLAQIIHVATDTAWAIGVAPQRGTA